ncbi:ABC transporter permease subunit, partial [Streptomyces sp. NPDC020096]
MTQTALLPPTDVDAVVKTTVKPGRLRGLRRTFAPIGQAHGMPKFMLWSGFVISGLFVLVALFAPLLAPYSFDQYQSGGKPFPKQGAPDGAHLFGTTVQSLDVLSRTIYGARTALEVMLLAVIFSLILGVLLGLLAGYFGGWLDRILVLVMDALFAFPYLLLAIVAGFVFSGVVGGGVVTAALSITVVYIPQYFRVVRSSALSAREALYVEAARAMGAKPSVVIRKYLFGNVVQSVPVITTMNAADAISTLAGLGFLGLGIQPTEAAEWGYDLQRAIDDVNAGMWWTALYPGIAMIIAILGFTLVGEGLNDVLNSSMRKRRITKVILPVRAAARRRVTAGGGSAEATAAASQTATEEAAPEAETVRKTAEDADGSPEPAEQAEQAPIGSAEDSEKDSGAPEEGRTEPAPSEPQAEQDVASASEREPDSTTEAAPHPEAETAGDAPEAKPEAVAEAEPEVEAAPETEPEVESKSEAVSEPKPELEPEAASEPEPEPEA